MSRFCYQDALHNGQYLEAEIILNKIIDQTDPSSVPARDFALLYNDRGQARYHQVKFQEAKQDYDLGISLYPGEGSIYYNRSTILYRMGAYAQALPGFEKAVELNPENIEFKAGLKSCLGFVNQGNSK